MGSGTFSVGGPPGAAGSGSASGGGGGAGGLASLNMSVAGSTPSSGGPSSPHGLHSASSAGPDKESAPEEEKYVIRPAYKDMFKPRVVQGILRSTLHERLNAKKYDPMETGNWTKQIATDVKTRLKALELKRYKYLVQVVIGENKGAGVRMGCRCLWDAQTDKVAEEVFINDSIFAVAVAFGVYLY